MNLWLNIYMHVGCMYVCKQPHRCYYVIADHAFTNACSLKTMDKSHSSRRSIVALIRVDTPAYRPSKLVMVPWNGGVFCSLCMYAVTIGASITQIIGLEWGLSFGKTRLVVFVLQLVCHRKSVRFHGFDPKNASYWSAGREWVGAFTRRSGVWMFQATERAVCILLAIVMRAQTMCVGTLWLAW